MRRFDNVSEIKDVVSQVGANQVSEIERKILDWITNITYGNEHSDIRNKRLPKTSEWLLETEEYHDWVSNSGKTLYCEGMPGAGKTIIASIIVDDLDRHQKESGIAYIYCNYKRAETQTVENLLKTMLRQLLQTRPLLPESVKSLYDEQKSRQTQPTLEEIRRLLRSTVASYPRVFIVIDALDECIGSDDCRSRYLQEIQELQKVYAVNALATSRPLPEVRKMPPFKNSPLVQLQALDEDIQVYLDYRISKFPSFVQLDIDLQRAIKDKIHGIVNGMFLLVKLYMDAIQDKVTSNSIKKAISAFGTNPDAYSEAYEAAIERIESQKSDRLTYAKKLLSWVSLAKRELSVSELEHALAVEPGARAIDKGDIPDLQDIISFCAGLVSIDQTSQVVKLVHLTAQTFLESKLAEFLPNAESSIAHICITYQCFDTFASEHYATEEEVKNRIWNYPLFNYAAHYWGQHTRNSHQSKYALQLLKQTASVQLSFQILSIWERPFEREQHRLFQRRTYRSFQRENHRGLRRGKERAFQREEYDQAPERDIVALHLLAYLGLDELVGEVIAEAEIDAKTSSLLTPLWIASAQGHEAVARLLIEHGATIDPDGNDGTPLFAAASRGHEAVARLLIERGATINPGGIAWPPIVGAVEQGHEAVVRLLIENGADIDQKNRHGETSLVIAASKGYEGVVKLLIEKGASTDRCDGLGWTPLVSAAGPGHKAVVELLLKNGADINECDWRGDTPLTRAASSGHTAIVKLLIEKGASINKADSMGETPLMRAASHETVVELLVKNGADINECNGSGETPLANAAKRGQEAIVKLLIDRGASINKAGKHCGWTPLAAAVVKGHKAVKSLLLKHGATIQSG
uniref:Uncharacterized protein n=1 Tax=Bionectria ochroleuca TaxID=29856 RepID=A0A0B7JZL9_BIOOC